MMGAVQTDDRGQIIVIAALLIAVLFVGLALILNSGIYAENLSTRGETSTSDAMTVESVTGERLGTAVDAANYRLDETADYATRRSHIRENVSDWDRLMSRREARNGRTYSTEVTGMTNGTRVNQSTMDDFEPANSSLLSADPLGLGSDTNWQAANESNVRDFEMTVRRGSLREVDTDLATELEYLLKDALTGSDRFWTEFEGNDTYRMFLLDDNGNGSVAVVVTEYNESGDDELVGTCSVDASSLSDNVTVRITDAELEGPSETRDCPALRAVDGGQQNLYYAGVDHVEGTYRFIADRPEGEFREGLRDLYDSLLGWFTGGDVYAGSPTDEDPYTTKAIYDVTAKTTYRDGRVTYVRNVSYPATAR